MKKTLFVMTGLLLSFTVFAAADFKGYAKEMQTEANKNKIKEMQKACAPVNNGLADKTGCEKLVKWQEEMQCKFGIENGNCGKAKPKTKVKK